MKKILITALVGLASTVSQSSAFAGLPGVDPCGVLGGCTQPMHEIWDGFDHAGSVKQNLIPSVYSGECYYLGVGYDKDQRQWGYTLLDSKDGGNYSDGWYSFYSPNNPYLGMTVADARQKTPEIFSPEKKLTAFEDYSFLDLTTPGGPVLQTWYRESADGSTLYTYGTWGIGTRRFCRFQRHTN